MFTQLISPSLEKKTPKICHFHLLHHYHPLNFHLLHLVFAFKSHQLSSFCSSAACSLSSSSSLVTSREQHLIVDDIEEKELAKLDIPMASMNYGVLMTPWKVKRGYWRWERWLLPKIQTHPNWSESKLIWNIHLIRTIFILNLTFRWIFFQLKLSRIQSDSKNDLNPKLLALTISFKLPI